MVSEYEIFDLNCQYFRPDFMKFHGLTQGPLKQMDGIAVNGSNIRKDSPETS